MVLTNYHSVREFPLALKLVYLISPHTTQALLKLLPLCWSLELVSMCVNHLRAVSQSSTILCFSQVESLLVFKARCYGDTFTQQKCPKL